MPAAPNTDQLRNAIDQGATADKVDFPDPAASPLGTDAEAGGNSASPKMVARAFKAEVKRRVPRKREPGLLPILAGVVLVIAVSAALSVWILSA